MATQAVAGTFNLDDNGVVQQPIHERGSNNRITEDLTPLSKASVGDAVLAGEVRASDLAITPEAPHL